MFPSTETNLKITFDCKKNNVNIQLLTCGRIVNYDFLINQSINYYFYVQLANVILPLFDAHVWLAMISLFSDKAQPKFRNEHLAESEIKQYY